MDVADLGKMIGKSSMVFFGFSELVRLGRIYRIAIHLTKLAIVDFNFGSRKRSLKSASKHWLKISSYGGR